MRDERVERLAQVVTEYSMGVQPGQTALISGPTLATRLLVAAYRNVLRLGANPVIDVQLPGLREILFVEGNDDQLQVVGPLERLGAEQADAHLRVIALENTRAMAGIDPAREQLFARSRATVRQSTMERAARGQLNWCLTLYPTQAHAQEAEMSLSQYEDFVATAGWLDEADPVARWRELGQSQARLIDWLAPRRDVHILAEDTDLRLSVAGRTWINSDGRRNFPSGEVFTGPIEHSVEGFIRFSFPMIVQGREVEDIRLWFEQGRVVRATAAKNGQFLEAMLDTDQGARFLGEFAFGTNHNISRFTRNTLFDEKIGGTVHMALGAGYPDTGSQNRSAIHYDLICDLRRGGEVRVDGDLILKDGQYQID